MLSMTFSVIPRLDSQRVSLPELSFSTAPSSRLAPSLLHSFKAGAAFCTEMFKVAQLVLAEGKGGVAPSRRKDLCNILKIHRGIARLGSSSPSTPLPPASVLAFLSHSVLQLNNLYLPQSFPPSLHDQRLSCARHPPFP